MKNIVLWGLPWLVLLTISASAAYGMTAAVAGAESVAGHTEIVTAALDGPLSSEPCDAKSVWMLQNAVSNGWIPARSAGYCRGAQAEVSSSLP
jgi:hypothetical protein